MNTVDVQTRASTRAGRLKPPRAGGVSAVITGIGRSKVLLYVRPVSLGADANRTRLGQGIKWGLANLVVRPQAAGLAFDAR